MKTPKRLLIALLLTIVTLITSKAYATELPVANSFDNSVDGNGTLRTALNEACNTNGDDTIVFTPWSSSHPSSKVITLDSPLVIPANCKGKVTILGRDGTNGVDVTLQASNVGKNQCALDIQSSGNHIQNLNIIGSKGAGVCVSGNNNELANLMVGYKLVAKTFQGNDVGIKISGDNNNVYDSIIAASVSHGLEITGDGNKVSKNFIGTTPENERAAQKSNAYGNGGDGVRIDGSKNRIGGSTGLKNWIAFNKGNGISVIGGANSKYDDLGFNNIYGNTKLGIDLGDDGVTANGSCVGGPNDCIEFPSMLRSLPYGTNNYVIQGRALSGSEVQVYLVNPIDDDTHGEGWKLLAKFNIPTGNKTLKAFSHLINGASLQAGVKISCLISNTDENGTETSEFCDIITLHDTPSISPDPLPTPTPPPGTCGDSVVSSGEDCDDGANHNDCDGCSDQCKTIPVATSCPSVTPTPTPTVTPTPTPGPCGNSVVNSGEDCDDGANHNDCDGCSDQCKIIPVATSCPTVTPTPGPTPTATPGPTPTATPGPTPTATPGPTPTATPVPNNCPPTNLMANAISSSQIDVNWTDNCPNELGYWLERAAGQCTDSNLSFVQVATLGINVAIYHDMGLNSNSWYCYRVRAFFSGFLASDYSNTDDAKTFSAPTDLPKAPSWLIATAKSSTTIEVNWIDNSNNETAFEMWRSVGDCNHFAFLTDTIPANTTDYIDTGLTPNTLYCYKVRAKNILGTSNYSNADDATTFPVPTTVPNPATNLSASAVSSTQIDVKWDDNATNEDGYQLERSVNVNCDPSTFSLLATLGVNATSYSDTGLTPNTKYCYRVRPFNLAGNGTYSNIDSATTLPVPVAVPADPSNLDATGVTSSRIDVNFKDNSDNEQGFIIERANGACADNNPFNAITTLLASPGVGGILHYSDMGLPANTIFCYRAKSFNSLGDSNYSNKDDGSTLPIPNTVPNTPIDLKAHADGPNQVTVTWTDGSTDEDVFVVERADGLCSANNPFSPVIIVPGVVGSGSTVTFIDKTVDANHSYCYRVFAHNVAGDSPPSNTADVTTPPEPCPDGDADHDGICNSVDNCPNGPNPNQQDADGDSIGDICDNCANLANQDQKDSNNNGIGDACESPACANDQDCDGVTDDTDNCPSIPNPDQLDSDHDGLGDVCDPTPNGQCAANDSDCDGIPNNTDNCPNVANPLQEDADHDGIGDVCDPTPATIAPLFPSLEGAGGGGCSLNPNSVADVQGMIPLALLVGPGLAFGMMRRRKKM